jgi:hypothetical protein
MRHPAFALSGHLAVAVLAAAVFAVAAAGCSNQGEGDFCDPDAGITGGDCADGLQCVNAPGLPSSTTAVSRSRCCPITGTPTTAVCSANSGAIGSPTESPDAAVVSSDAMVDAPDESSVAESGAAEASVPESDGSAGLDAALDSASEAASDAAPDGSDAAGQ